MWFILVSAVAVFVDPNISCTPEEPHMRQYQPCTSDLACQCHCINITISRQLCYNASLGCAQYAYTDNPEIVSEFVNQYGSRKCECGWPTFGSYTACTLSLTALHDKRSRDGKEAGWVAFYAFVILVVSGCIVIIALSIREAVKNEANDIVESVGLDKGVAEPVGLDEGVAEPVRLDEGVAELDSPLLQGYA